MQPYILLLRFQEQNKSLKTTTTKNENQDECFFPLDFGVYFGNDDILCQIKIKSKHCVVGR